MNPDLSLHARETLASVIETGGRQMAKEPWRIARAIGRSSHWPVEGMTLFEIDATVDRKIREETLRQGHWTFDSNRLIGLKQAQRALEIMNG